MEGILSKNLLDCVMDILSSEGQKSKQKVLFNSLKLHKMLFLATICLSLECVFSIEALLAA